MQLVSRFVYSCIAIVAKVKIRTTERSIVFAVRKGEL
jgi:hypothetical protein